MILGIIESDIRRQERICSMTNSTNSKAPGKSFRQGISLMEVMEMFSTEKKAKDFFFKHRWGKNSNINCPYCGSFNVAIRKSHPSMPYRCREWKACGKFFSLKTDTIMEASPLSYRTWGLGIYMTTTEIKGKSSMKLHRDLGITQKTAWFMIHRIRESYASMVSEIMEAGDWAGTVEVDETAVGGSALKMNKKQHKAFKERGGGQGFAGKEIIQGLKNRELNKVVVRRLIGNGSKELTDFILAQTDKDAIIMTDGAAYALEGKREHQAVDHSTKRYVDGMAHNNGMESFWSLFKRGIDGNFHKVSPKHVERYVFEFAGRHNDRDEDTLEQMGLLVKGMLGQRLTYEDLTADNGRSNFARPESGSEREKVMLEKKERRRRYGIWQAWKEGRITPETCEELAGMIASKKAAGNWEDRIPY